MARVAVDRCSVSQDDYGDWWLEFYVDDIRYTILVGDVAAQQSVQADTPMGDGVKCPICGEVDYCIHRDD